MLFLRHNLSFFHSLCRRQTLMSTNIGRLVWRFTNQKRRGKSIRFCEKVPKIINFLLQRLYLQTLECGQRSHAQYLALECNLAFLYASSIEYLEMS